MSATKFLAGFIVGGAIGAIAGVLLAPKSGEETRAMLADGAKKNFKTLLISKKKLNRKLNNKKGQKPFFVTMDNHHRFPSHPS